MRGTHLHLHVQHWNTEMQLRKVAREKSGWRFQGSLLKIIYGNKCISTESPAFIVSTSSGTTMKQLESENDFMMKDS